MDQKEHPARRVLANYPGQTTFHLLFSDMDSLRHINNGATARYFEEGRAALNTTVFGARILTAPDVERQIMLAATQLDYLAQAYYPGTMEIGTAIGRIGTRSWQIVQAAFQNGQCVALSQSAMVLASHGRSTPLDADDKTRLQCLMLGTADCATLP